MIPTLACAGTWRSAWSQWLTRSGKQFQIGDETFAALDAILAELRLRLFEHHQNRRIPGLEDAEIAAVGVQFAELRLDGYCGQPLGDVDQLDQAFDRDPGSLDLAAQRLGGSGLRLPL